MGIGILSAISLFNYYRNILPYPEDFYRPGVHAKKNNREVSQYIISNFQQGDFVVHVDHGIGQYQGLKKITVQGNERECLSIVYRDGDFLYVPLDRMNRVQKYSAKDGAVPSLSKLGSRDWDRLKKKTKKRVKDIAKDF